jgi:hypothetical protein
MEIGLGAMGMRASEFWDQSPGEWYAAIRGFQQFHSAKPPPLSRDELNDLMERYPD